MKQKTYDIATTKGLHHQDRKYHSPHPEDIFVKTGPEQGLPINLNMLNHPKRWQFKVNKVNTCRTNHSWQVFMTTVGFQRIFYICLFFKWIHLFHKFHHSKVYTIHYSLLGSTSCSEIHWDKKQINVIHHFSARKHTHRNGESLMRKCPLIEDFLAGHVWKVVPQLTNLAYTLA